MSYTHFTLEERIYLQKLLAEGYSMRRIAAILERSPSSVSREVARNRSRYKPQRPPDNPYYYNHWRAQNLAVMRRRRHQQRSLRPGSAEWEFVVNGLRKYWSPEAICGRWSREYPDRRRLSCSTIYRYVKRKYFPDITPRRHLRRHGKRMMPRNACYNSIQPDRTIPQWPEEIRKRLRIGDWEGDTVYGGNGKGLLVSLVDRKSRYLCAGLLTSRNAEETSRVILRLLDGLPVTSISLDNGSEFAQFRDLEATLGTLIYFAEPHKPWQRGTNENTNDILRFFFPKGYDFNDLTPEELGVVLGLINKRPRKCLGWLSPFEVFWGVALD